MTKQILIIMTLILMHARNARSDTADQIAKRASDAQALAAEKARRDFFEASDKCFSQLEQADRQYAASLDSALTQAMHDGNLKLANKYADEKRQVLNRADREKAHDPQLLPHEATTELHGVRTRGKKVVFLCQAGGSILGRFSDVKEDLRAAIKKLDERSGLEFNVLFFCDDNVYPAFKDGLRLATDENKNLAIVHIDGMVCTGGSTPISGAKAAFMLKPDVVYLLADGFPTITEKDPVLRAFTKANANNATVNSIFYIDDADTALSEFMREVGSDGHGEMVKVEIKR